MRSPKRFVLGLLAISMIAFAGAAYAPLWGASFPPIGGVYALGRVDEKILAIRYALSGFFIWPEVARLAPRVSTGYRMLWAATGDRSCRMTHKVKPCDPSTTLKAAIDRGIEAGAQFLEIYNADILNPELQGLLAQTHERLSPGSVRY